MLRRPSFVTGIESPQIAASNSIAAKLRTDRPLSFT
jgi:hypothetical protein